MYDESEKHPGSANSSVSHEAGWRLLLSRNFGPLFSGQIISQIGDGLNKVALLWFVYELTGSALKMMVIGMLQTIPPLAFGPLIGVYLDRLPKKAVLIWVDLLRTLMVMLIPALYTVEALTLGRLYLLVFLIAIVSTVFGPALSAAVPQIVDRSRLTAANALLQSTANIGVLIGPAVGGLGIALVGAHNVLFIDAATFFISALCLMPIRMRRQPDTSRGHALSGGLVHDLLVGFRFVFVQHRMIAILMVSTALYNLGASAFMFLLPVFAKESLGVGPVELGWLWSILGLGMLGTSTCLVWIRQGDLHRRLRMVSGSIAVGGLAVCGLSLLETPLLASALMLIVGSSTAFLMPVVLTSLQELTPGPLLGRVFTTFSTGGMACAIAGMMGFGWVADTINPSVSFLGIGFVLLGTAVFIERFMTFRESPVLPEVATAES